jgi:1,4-dihydroxy-2-naphthoate octaprenyltransferase
MRNSALPAVVMSPPSAFGAWWLAIRPKTLSMSLAPVLVGATLAWRDSGQVAWAVSLIAALAALLIQVGANLHNDAADFERGADTPERVGPPRAVAQGWLAARAVRHAAYAAFACAFLLGIGLVWTGGWPILVLGLASLGAGLAYTGGPRPIAYTGMGELFVFLFFGLAAVAGTYYLGTGAMSDAALAAGAALGSIAAAVLTANNYRDLDNDRRAGKITLAVRIGRRATRIEYAALLLSPYALLPLIAHGAAAWLPLLSLPGALWLIARFARTPPGAAFNALLARTAQLQLAFGVLLALGLGGS